MSYKPPNCCPNTCCYNCCFWDDSFITMSIGEIYCEGYVNNRRYCCGNLAKNWKAFKLKVFPQRFHGKLTNCLMMACEVIFWRIPTCMMNFGWFIVFLCLISVFTPPLLFYIASLPAFTAPSRIEKSIDPFEWIDGKQEMRADPTTDGHVSGRRFPSQGWVRCVFISLILCFLGWIPAILFDFLFICWYIRFMHVY